LVIIIIIIIIILINSSLNYLCFDYFADISLDFKKFNIVELPLP